MTEFKLRPHDVLPGTQIVEVWEDAQLVAVIYPRDGGMTIASKYLPETPAQMAQRLAYGPVQPRKLEIVLWDGRPRGPVALEPGLSLRKRAGEPLPPPPEPAMHILAGGFALCMFGGVIPAGWPDGHTWIGVSDPAALETATCGTCRQKFRDMMVGNR